MALFCDVCLFRVDSVNSVTLKVRIHGWVSNPAAVNICDRCLEVAPPNVEFHCTKCDGFHGALDADCPLAEEPEEIWH